VTRIIFTYAQLKAAKDVLANRSPVNWKAYDEFKALILTAPLDLPEESEEPADTQFPTVTGYLGGTFVDDTH
jgi:hypothetical protein